MNNLQVFQNEEFGSLEVIWENGKPLFRAVQAAKMLGYQKPHDAIQRHCRDSVKRGVIDSLGRTQEVIFIPEGDLYRLIVHSKLPSAQRFESWVFDSVLPSVRQNGMYATDELLNNPDLLIQVATKLKEERQKRLEIESKIIELSDSIKEKDSTIAELKPKADYFETVLACPDAVATSIIADDYGKSATWLNKLLAQLGVQYKLKKSKCWILKQPYKDKGYIVHRTHTGIGQNGELRSFTNMYWTQKGRLFIYDLLKVHGILPLIEQEKCGF